MWRVIFARFIYLFNCSKMVFMIWEPLNQVSNNEVTKMKSI